MDPNKEIDELEEMEESEGPDEEFEPELDSDSDEKNDIEDNDLDEEVGDNEVIVDTDDDASIYDDDASDVDGDDDDNDIDQEDALEDSIVKNKKTKSKTTKQTIQMNSQYNNYDSDDDGNGDDEDDDENYLQKFSKEINKKYIEKEHPECIFHNYNEISALTKVIRDKNNNIIDPLHRTVPFLTKYEKTRIIGQRAKQINSGAKPFVNVPQHIIDGYIIAELELKQKKIPFIIKRPIPGGGSEYWNVKDLELI
jgi:DNA-directed RNA polymerase I, II, and III subunit RPABC2